MFRLSITLYLALVSSGLALADDAAAFFNDSEVREIRLYFDDTNWYNTLLAGHRTEADPYYPCRFQYGNTVISQIGCRFKGNSSFQRNGVKKAFKLDFNEYDDGATFLGLKKLNLNNFDLSPDFMREKLVHELAGKYVAALRSVYVRLYVNDSFYGLYLAVEQPDKTMMQSRFGKDEDGNLYEAEERIGTGAHGDLSYLGADPTAYQSVYLLKTNEAANDYSGLIEFLDVLNNTPAAELPARLEPIADVENWLYSMALNNLVVNLDSYIGVAAEYYLYDRSSDGKFIHIQWDNNESFGITGDGTPQIAVPANTDPFYLPSGSTGGGPRPGGGGTATSSRPLLQKLWAVDAYKRLYLQMMARFLREGFNPDSMGQRIQQIATLIREHVQADPNKPYTNAQFESSLNSQVAGGQISIPGLNQFIASRYSFLRSYLNSQTQPADVRLNEIVIANSGSNRDAAGDADPWVELYNLGPGPVTLSGFYLTDDAAKPTKWALPERTLADGEFLVVWLDAEPSEGDTHANFQPQAGGGSVYLFSTATATGAALDTVTYPALSVGQAMMRAGAYGSQWSVTAEPTAGAANRAVASAPAAVEGTGQLLINEIMADNKTTIQDPDEPGAFEDWIEIYNPGTSDVDMSGMYLTDNSANRTKYKIPQGVRVPARGFVVFWTDNDTGQGSQHTNFALDADGEYVALYQPDGQTLIDSLTFTTQQEDISFGRASDGAGEWTIFRPATPGASNTAPFANWIANAASFRLGPLAPGTAASAFRERIASSIIQAPATPLPTTLGGVTVTITDSTGAVHKAPLFVVSSGQVNFEIPAGVAAGRARLDLGRQDGTTLTGDVLVAPVGPGLFSANATGEGVGLIAAMRVDAAGGQTLVPVFSYDDAQQKVVATPISVSSASEQVYLTIYATGLRNRANLSDVKVQVGDVDIPVLYAAAQSEYVGLDQVNVGPLPRSLAGSGAVEVELTVAVRRANRVTVTIE